jgi:hypothetical protein
MLEEIKAELKDLEVRKLELEKKLELERKIGAHGSPSAADLEFERTVKNLMISFGIKRFIVYTAKESVSNDGTEVVLMAECQGRDILRAHAELGKRIIGKLSGDLPDGLKNILDLLSKN